MYSRPSQRRSPIQINIGIKAVFFGIKSRSCNTLMMGQGAAGCRKQAIQFANQGRNMPVCHGGLHKQGVSGDIRVW